MAEKNATDTGQYLNFTLGKEVFALDIASVREVLDSVARVSGKKLDIRIEPRREGDPPVLVSRAVGVREKLGWVPKLDDLDTIVRNSLRWEEKLLREPWAAG